MRTAAVRRVLARSPVVATDLIGFVLARIVGFGRPHTPYEPPILSIRKGPSGRLRVRRDEGQPSP